MFSLLAMVLTGCQGIAGSPQYSQVRFVAASPDAPGLDVYEGASVFTYNVGFSYKTTYVPIVPGAYTFSVNNTGTKQQLASVKQTIAAGGQYTFVASNAVANLQLSFLNPDQTTAAPANQISVRFVDETTRTGPVDIYLLPSGSTLSGVSTLVSGISFGQNAGYINVPAGTYSVVVVPTGTVPAGTTSPLNTATQVVYPGGAARTFILLDQQLITMPGVQVMTLDDYDSPGATN